MQTNLIGHFDEVSSDGWIAGWASDLNPDSNKVLLDIVVDGVVIATERADQFREDLAKTDLNDPSCAFWFSLPDEYRDGKPHDVTIKVAGTELVVPGSPRQFLLPVPDEASRSYEIDNLLPNASFTVWPSGLSVRPVEPFTEIAQGWYFDFKRGRRPAALISADKPVGLALGDSEYAMRVEITKASESGYTRLVAPMQISPADAGLHLFSCGWSRPVRSSENSLRIGEIYLASIRGRHVSRLQSIRKNLLPIGTLRIRDIPVAISEKLIAELGDDGRLALVLEFQSKGELLLFSPRLQRRKEVAASATQPGRFEDDQIFSQIPLLKLSPIWSDKRGEPEPSEVLSRPLHKAAQVSLRHSGLPFTQIVIPVFNAAQDVCALLESLVKHTCSPFEVLLMDDGSGDYAKYRLREWVRKDPRIRLISHDTNVGYTRNINIGLQMTVAEYVVLLNSDTIVTPRWLDKLHEVMALDPTIAGVGPVSNAASWQSVPETKAPDGSWAVNALRAGTTVDAFAAMVEACSEAAFPEFPLLNGFCTLFRKSALEAVGHFDDATFPQGYGEENDLCLRLTRAGHTLRVADHCYVHHKKSKSFGSDRRAELSRKAGSLLKKKHPTVKLAKLEEQMKLSPALSTLRHRLLEVDQVELLEAPKIKKIHRIRSARREVQA